MIKLYQPNVSKRAIEAVVAVLESGQLAQGPEVTLLEKRFAKYVQVDHAVAVNNGTAALHAALYALEIQPGDEVIVPAFTFVATANAVLMAGAKPVFVDIEPESYALNPESIERMITPRTRAVIGVNLYGLPADWSSLRELASAYDLVLIEDAAQSIGAKYQDTQSGGLADIGCFSFYATKNLMSGEGGMVTTNKAYLAQRVRHFRHHGQDHQRRYTYRDLGYNYRLTDIQAALLLDGLRSLDKETKIRQAHAARYLQSLRMVEGLGLPTIPAERTHVFHQFTIRITPGFPLSRRQLMHYLNDKEIQSGVYYPKPLYTAPHLARFRRDGRELVEVERASREVLSLPIHPYLSAEEVELVGKTIRGIETKVGSSSAYISGAI